MIIKQKTVAFVQQAEPKRKYDPTNKKFTDEVETTPDGFTRYVLTLAVPGEREQLRVSTDEAQLMKNVGLDAVGKIIEVSYIARVELKWASVEDIAEVTSA